MKSAQVIVDQENSPDIIMRVDGLMRQAEFDQALALLDASDVQDATWHIVRQLECCISLGLWERAESVYRTVERESEFKGNAALARAYFHILAGQKRYPEAYSQSFKLSESVRDEPNVWRLISFALASTSITSYDPLVERDLLKAIQDPSIETRSIRKRITELFNYKYKLLDKQVAIRLQDWASDELFLLYLKTEYSLSPRLEKLLIQMRNNLLTTSLANMNLDDKYTHLVGAIAWQNWHNEYVHVQTSQEAELIQNLEALLQQQVAQPAFAIRDVEGLLLLVAMYKSLDDIGCSSALRAIPLTDWPLSLASLAKRSLFDIRKELAYAEKIPSLGSINNAVSQKVRAQYEENPYPRWMHCIRLKDKMDYFDGLWSSFLPVQHKNKPEIAKPEILIAGCGTGLHPLQVALNHPANVTAVDITRRSLGYAAMKQAEYKADNLTFYHMDLLDLQRLDKTFDAIECGGVLHHMADPEAGLEALLSVLKPEGILTLGLYSEIARRNVVNVRNAYLKTGMQPTLENIRAVRSALIHNQADITYSLVALFGDFYSTSACRDLLFHEQEHRFTTSQLKDLLIKYDLEFLGIVVKPAARNRFIQEYGADKLCDLDAWGEYEEAHPGTFGNMYQFQVRRRNPGTIH